MNHLFSNLIVLSIAFFLSIPLYSNGAQESTSSSGPVKGTIAYLEGDVEINGNTAEIGDTVINSDTISTGENAFCEVVFENANVFRLDELTIAQINWEQSDIQLTQGGFSAVFNKLDKLIREMKDFTISTNTTAAGVRGTVFYARVESEDSTYLCICNGELAVEYGNSNLDISATQHKAYRFSGTGNDVTYELAPLLYHDDEKMDEIASRIDYEIPWGEYENY